MHTWSLHSMSWALTTIGIALGAAVLGALGVLMAVRRRVPAQISRVVQGAQPTPPAPGAPVAQAVIAYCREHLADFKVPQYVATRGEPLPRNPGGKLLKKQLREETEWGTPLR